MHAARDSAAADWDKRVAVAVGGKPIADLPTRLASAGALGFLSNTWSEGWGVDKIMSGGAAGAITTIPMFDVSCEDYSLLARLATHGQRPRVHAQADARLAPHESPVFNTIARLDGSEHPDQYVMLSAHLDSWDLGTGATDDGAGVAIVTEVGRLIAALPQHPRRTLRANPCKAAAPS